MDMTANQDAGNAPHHQVYLRANWEFLPDWHASPQIKWIVNRERVAGDNRPPVGDYSMVDFTLRRSRVAEHLEVAFSVRNLFDTDIRESSPFATGGAPIPHDFPMAGRNFYGELRLNF
jgi:iron complex outermembrane receptor protein